MKDILYGSLEVSFGKNWAMSVPSVFKCVVTSIFIFVCLHSCVHISSGISSVIIMNIYTQTVVSGYSCQHWLKVFHNDKFWGFPGLLFIMLRNKSRTCNNNSKYNTMNGNQPVTDCLFSYRWTYIARTGST